MLDLWILTHRRVGDLNQMRTLASALEARVVEKQIRFRSAQLARTMPFLSLVLMDEEKSSPLAPPWPELVLVAEGSVGNIALEVRRRSGGKTKVVCLGRPRGRIGEFDLVITTPQFGLASAPNVLELTLPLHRLDALAMEKAAASLLPQLSHLPRPWLVLLVGGTSHPDILDEGAASALAAQALARARQQGASLLVVTSPRTGVAAEKVLAQALGRTAHLSVWSQAAAGTPYLGYLHLADSFIVTSDSVSMTTEAILTGKPVEVYRLPQRLGGLKHAISRLARSNRWPLRTMHESGLVEEKPRRDRFYQNLTASIVSLNHRSSELELETEKARSRVLSLLSDFGST
jgi:mitochondrial fission protein ELM1